MSIRRLPWEIISYIAQELELDDLFNLALTCRQLQGLIHDDNVCRRALESRAPWTTETQEARQTKRFARELRRLVKRRAALSSASPYLAAIVAVAESYLYTDGVLCYISDGRLRILDLHNSASREQVLDIAAVVRSDSSLPDWERRRPDSELQLIYYSHGFVTCRYSRRRTHPGWLVVIDTVRGLVFSQQLESAAKLFVRNNAEFLYYGVHSEAYEYDDRRWAVRCCNLREAKWYPQKLVFTEIVGSEIGANICFEIIDGYFYCLANRANFEIEEIHWKSYYVYLRIPVGEPPTRQHPDGAQTEVIWRKDHAEGPIDDRWTFLRLVKHEVTGAVTVVESRKEWMSGKSTSMRTYYTSELEWPQRRGSNGCPPDDNTGAGLSLTVLSSFAGGSGGGGVGIPSGSGIPGASDHWSGAKEASVRADARSPHTVHPGDDTSSYSMSTLSSSLMRTYHPGCQTFIDLVNDEVPCTSASGSTQRIRLRAGSRRLRTPKELRELGNAYADLPDNALYPERQIKTLYRAIDVKCWPPDQCQGLHLDPDLEDLFGVLNPGTHQGPVCGVWDERSMCYATDTADKALKAIVFISWDPSIRLRGVQSWLRRRGGDDQCQRQNEIDRSHRVHRVGNASIDEQASFSRQAQAQAAPLLDTITGFGNGSSRIPGDPTKGKQKAAGAEGEARDPRATSLSNANDSSPAAPATEPVGERRSRPPAAHSGSCSTAAKAPGSAAAAASAGATTQKTALAPTGRDELPFPPPTSSPEWIWTESPMYAAIHQGYDFTQ